MPTQTADCLVPPELAACTWVAGDLWGKPTLRSDRPNLKINSNGVVFGTAGCNRFIGAAEINDGSIRLSLLYTKGMLCPAPLMDQEERFMRAMSETRSFGLEGSSLRFFNEAGRELASFEPLIACTRNANVGSRAGL